MTGTLARIFWTSVLGFASIVEFSHFRYFLMRNDFRSIPVLFAAIACGFMAAEALEGKWPEWGS